LREPSFSRRRIHAIPPAEQLLRKTAKPILPLADMMGHLSAKQRAIKK
jgi:hypothetical protein